MSDRDYNSQDNEQLINEIMRDILGSAAPSESTPAADPPPDSSAQAPAVPAAPPSPWDIPLTTRAPEPPAQSETIHWDNSEYAVPAKKSKKVKAGAVAADLLDAPSHPDAPRMTPQKKKGGPIWVYNVAIGLCLCVFLVSAFFLGRWMLENHKTKQLAGDLNSLAQVSDSKISDGGVEVFPPLMSSNTDPNGKIPYYKLNMEQLVERNKDTVGWVRVSGTNINYPITQTGDNEYYLTRDFERNYTRAGWIFGDFRCDFTDITANKNLIIYGHGRRDYSMFGSLEYCRRSWWLRNTDYHTVHVTTLTEESVWRVFAVYPTSVDFYYIQTEFVTTNAFTSLVDQMKAKSVYDFGVDVGPDDTILTLSTCTTDADRLVLNAVLVSVDPRTSE